MEASRVLCEYYEGAIFLHQLFRAFEVVKRSKDPVLVTHLVVLGGKWADGDNRD